MTITTRKRRKNAIAIGTFLVLIMSVMSKMLSMDLSNECGRMPSAVDIYIYPIERANLLLSDSLLCTFSANKKPNKHCIAPFYYYCMCVVSSLVAWKSI